MFSFLMLRGFNVHIQSKLLKHTFVMGAISDLGQPLHPRKKVLNQLFQLPLWCNG